MRFFWIATAVCTAAILALVFLCLGALAGEGTYSSAAVRRFQTWDSVLSPAKFLLPIVLLVIADRTVTALHLSGRRRAALLWTPLLAFVVYSWLDWATVGDAYIHYLRRHDRWGGGLSGAVIYMVFAYPAAIIVSALNAVWVRLRLARHKPRPAPSLAG